MIIQFYHVYVDMQCTRTSHAWIMNRVHKRTYCSCPFKCWQKLGCRVHTSRITRVGKACADACQKHKNHDSPMHACCAPPCKRRLWAWLCCSRRVVVCYSSIDANVSREMRNVIACPNDCEQSRCNCLFTCVWLLAPLPHGEGRTLRVEPVRFTSSSHRATIKCSRSKRLSLLWNSSRVRKHIAAVSWRKFMITCAKWCAKFANVGELRERDANKWETNVKWLFCAFFF